MAKAKKSRDPKTQAAEAISVADQLGEIMGHFIASQGFGCGDSAVVENIEDAHSGDETDALRVAIEMPRWRLQ